MGEEDSAKELVVKICLGSVTQSPAIYKQSSTMQYHCCLLALQLQYIVPKLDLAAHEPDSYISSIYREKKVTTLLRLDNLKQYLYMVYPTPSLKKHANFSFLFHC